VEGGRSRPVGEKPAATMKAPNELGRLGGLIRSSIDRLVNLLSCGAILRLSSTPMLPGSEADERARHRSR
jgi:hypothetical protein